MALTKKQRQQIWDKSGGVCWYCGCKLEKGWHVDHFEPVYRETEIVGDDTRFGTKFKQTGKSRFPDREGMDNLVPACAVCNRFKSVFTVEKFRKELEKQVERARKSSVNYRMAEKYRLVREQRIQVMFWFENKSPGNCMCCCEPITFENNGISINNGEFYQCEDCHEIEFGYGITGGQHMVFNKDGERNVW